jgi:hypothetical protein
MPHCIAICALGIFNCFHGSFSTINCASVRAQSVKRWPMGDAVAFIVYVREKEV